MGGATLGVVLALTLASAAHAYDAITNATIVSSTNPSELRSDILGDGGELIDVTYNGTEFSISSFVANGMVYEPILTGQAYARRNSGTETFPTTNANQTSAWNAVVSVTGTAPNVAHEVDGQYYNTMEELFTSRNIHTGTENLFVNTSDPGNVVTNVERMDFIFSTPLTASDDLGFAIFERGRGFGNTSGGTNGGFKVAAILSVSGTTPTDMSAGVVTVTDNSYNNGNNGVALGGALVSTTFAYDVFRYAAAAGPELDAFNNVNIGPQGIAGALILTTDLVPEGTTIYGYAVFGEDVFATGNDLLDVTNTTFFDPLSDFENDMDMIASGAILFKVIPEPSSVTLVALGVLGLGVFVRRRSQVG